MKVFLAKQTWCLTQDKQEKVSENDERAAWLLVRAGSPIAPEVAAFWGIETYEGEAVSKMPRSIEEEHKGMVTPGTPPQVAKNFDAMQIRRNVHEEVRSNLTVEGNPAARRQAALTSEAIANKQTGNVGEDYKTQQDALAVGSTGFTAPLSEEGEEESTGELTPPAFATPSDPAEQASVPAAANSKTKDLGGGEKTDKPEKSNAELIQDVKDAVAVVENAAKAPGSE